jgi:hypothetical protein
MLPRLTIDAGGFHLGAMPTTKNNSAQPSLSDSKR